MNSRAKNNVLWWVWVCAVVIAMLGLTQRASAQTLTNSDIVKMVQAKLGDDVIISEIKHSTCNFDTSPSALIKLKEAGVSDKVLEAMTEAANGTSGGRAASPTSNESVASPLPENYGIYALDHGKLYDLFGGNPSEGPPIRVIGVYSFEINNGKTYSAGVLEPRTAFIIFDQASGDLSRALSLYRLPFGRYEKVGGHPNPINGILAARLQAFRIPLLSKPVPGQSQMVEASPNSPLAPGDYLLFLIRGQQYQAQLVVVGPPPTIRAEERGSCVDISFPGGYGGFMEMGDYWAMHGPPEFPEITPDHYSDCSGGQPPSTYSSPNATRPGAAPALVPCNDYKSCMQAGSLAEAASSWQVAITDFQTAAKSASANPLPWSHLADTHLRAGQYAEAQSAWDKVLSLGGTVDIMVCREVVFGPSC